MPLECSERPQDAAHVCAIDREDEGGGLQPGRNSSRIRGASHSGRTGSVRRWMWRTLASTEGRGRNAFRPIGTPRSKCHHGAHAAVRSDAGGTDVCLRATSCCRTKSARTGQRSGFSNSRLKISVVSANGGLATTRYGSRGNRNRRTSVSRIRSRWPTPADFADTRSFPAHRESGSTAHTVAPASASGIESAPAPAPISTTSSPGRRSSDVSRRETSCSSTRKF